MGQASVRSRKTPVRIKGRSSMRRENWCLRSTTFPYRRGFPTYGLTFPENCCNSPTGRPPKSRVPTSTIFRRSSGTVRSEASNCGRTETRGSSWVRMPSGIPSTTAGILRSRGLTERSAITCNGCFVTTGFFSSRMPNTVEGRASSTSVASCQRALPGQRYFAFYLFTKRSFAADLDFDGDADLNDFAVLQRCFGAQVSTIAGTCTSSDTSGNGLVDLDDFLPLARYLDGPAEGACADYNYWRDCPGHSCCER